MVPHRWSIPGFFTSVRIVAALSNPYGIHNQEWDGHVYLCAGPRRPWAQLCPGCATTADSRGISTRNPASGRLR